VCFTAQPCLIRPRVCAARREAASRREDCFAKASVLKWWSRFGSGLRNTGGGEPKANQGHCPFKVREYVRNYCVSPLSSFHVSS